MFNTFFFNPWFALSCCTPPRPSGDDNTVVTYDPVRVAKSGSAILESHGNVHFVKIAKLGDYVEYQAGDVLVCRINEMRGLMIFGPETDPFMAVAREWFIATNTVRPSKRKGEGIVSANVITAVYEDKDWDYLISKAQVGVVPILPQPVVTSTAHMPAQSAMDNDALASLNPSAAAPEEPKKPAVTTEDDIDEILKMLDRRSQEPPVDPSAAARKPEEPKKPAVETQSLDITDALEILAYRRSQEPPVDPPAESQFLTPMSRRERSERRERFVLVDEDGNDLIAQEQAKRATEPRKKQSRIGGLFGGRKKDVATIAATSSMDEDW